MTVVYCMLRRCIRNLNGICKRTRVYIKNGKCSNLRPRLREEFDVGTKVVCGDINCPFNRDGLCVRTEIFVTEKGCMPKEGEG